MNKTITIKRPVFDLILCISLFVIFVLSILLSYLFISYDYGETVNLSDNNQNITIPYEKLIEGNTSGNMAQYLPSTHEGFGSFCVNSDYFYYAKNDKKNSYLIKASISSPSSEYPILEGYDVDYINIVGETVYCLAKATGSQEPRKIYSMSSEGGNFVCLETDFTKDITSLVTNSNYLYFSVNGTPSIYVSTLDGKKVETLASFSAASTGIRLFGIDKNNLYFVNDSYMGKVDFASGQKLKLNSECYSLYQSPILTSDGILYYSSMNCSDCMYVSKAGGPSTRILSSSQMKESLGNIRYINYSSGYVFVIADRNIYYSALGTSEMSLLKGIELSENGRAFFNNEYCIAETDDGIKSVNINWLLSQ